MGLCKEYVSGSALPEIPTCGATLDPDGDPIICAALFEDPCFLGYEGVVIEESEVLVHHGKSTRVRIKQTPVLPEV